MANAPRYVIYAPGYDAKNGGAMVMHRLCHMLNQLGENAVVFPMKPLIGEGRRRRLYKWLFPQPYMTNPDYQTPTVKKGQITDSDIVIYPELVGTNPLLVKNVVYWLLNRPSFHNRQISPSDHDLFFKYDDRCNEPELTGGDVPTLFLFTLRVRTH